MCEKLIPSTVCQLKVLDRIIAMYCIHGLLEIEKPYGTLHSWSTTCSLQW